VAGRLENQCRKILKLLRERGNQGATNYELAQIALKYTSRVSDLRDAGYRVHCTCEDAVRGVYRYHYLGRSPTRRRELFYEGAMTNDEGHEKLGVEEDAEAVKTATSDPRCPSCGGKLDANANVPKCPKCGTKPFEGTDASTS
jgi:ABC-type ATPase with predicted acetyltransferase domain